MAGTSGSQNHNANGNDEVIAAILEMVNTIRESNHHMEDEGKRVMRIQREFRKSKPPIFRCLLIQ